MNLRIGIIDSGINDCALKSKVFHRNCIDNSDAEKDKNGHGTMCAYLIEKYSEAKVEFYSYKIFDEDLWSTEKIIEKAFRRAYQDKLDILNLSLSIHVMQNEKIKKLVKKLQESGVIVIAAKAKTGERTLLDTFDKVLMVRGKSFFSESKLLAYGNQIICDGEPILAKWYNHEYDFIGGNSKATALCTAFICKKITYTGEKRYKVYHKNEYQEDKLRNNEKFEKKILEILSQYTKINKEKLEQENDWTLWGDFFLDKMIKVLIIFFGDNFLDRYTIFYAFFNNKKSFLYFINQYKEQIKCLDLKKML